MVVLTRGLKGEDDCGMTFERVIGQVVLEDNTKPRGRIWRIGSKKKEQRQRGTA